MGRALRILGLAVIVSLPLLAAPASAYHMYLKRVDTTEAPNTATFLVDTHCTVGETMTFISNAFQPTSQSKQITALQPSGQYDFRFTAKLKPGHSGPIKVAAICSNDRNTPDNTTTLPFTGAASPILLGLGLALVVAGTLLLRLGRQADPNTGLRAK
jgi:hypothetical protein